MIEYISGITLATHDTAIAVRFCQELGFTLFCFGPAGYVPLKRPLLLSLGGVYRWHLRRAGPQRLTPAAPSCNHPGLPAILLEMGHGMTLGRSGGTTGALGGWRGLGI